MPLDFDSAGSTRGMDCGAGASISDWVNFGAMTGWAWVLRTSNGANQHVITKDASAPNRGWLFLVTDSPAEGCLQLVIVRSVTNNNTLSNSSNVVALNVPTFIAYSFRDAATPEAKLFIGTVDTPVREVTGYTTQTDGVGTCSDAAALLYIGNLQRANTNPFRGQIAYAGGAQYEMNLDELQRIQYQPWDVKLRAYGRSLSLACDDPVWNMDRTGNQNNGEVTGALAVPAWLPLKKGSRGF